MATVDGKTVKAGDWVCFKSDIEQCGKVVRVDRDTLGRTVLVLENDNGFEGDYIGGETRTVELASDCWRE